MFTGTTITIATDPSGTYGFSVGEFAWQSATEDAENHSDLYANANAWLSVTGKIATPSVATVSISDGSVTRDGFLSGGGYFDRVQQSSIETESRSFHGRDYQGVLSTTTYSLNTDSSFSSAVSASYQGSHGDITINTSSDGTGTISGAEHGWLVNGEWLVNNHGPLGSPSIVPPHIFGQVYTYTNGDFNLEYFPDGSSNYWETSNFAAPQEASCSIFISALHGQGTTISLEGNDSVVGSYTGEYTGSGFTITSQRTAPSFFAKTTIWHLDTPLVWVPGVSDGSGLITDTYYGDNGGNPITVTVSGYLRDYRADPGAVASVTVILNDGGQHSGSYYRQSGNFSVSNFDLALDSWTQRSTHTGPRASLWVNGSEYSWREGFTALTGDQTDTYAHESLGSLILFLLRDRRNHLRTVRHALLSGPALRGGVRRHRQ